MIRETTAVDILKYMKFNQFYKHISQYLKNQQFHMETLLPKKKKKSLVYSCSDQNINRIIQAIIISKATMKL